MIGVLGAAAALVSVPGTARPIRKPPPPPPPPNVNATRQ
jgi:hypothetical protein